MQQLYSFGCTGVLQSIFGIFQCVGRSSGHKPALRATVQVFGSAASGFGDAASDLDLTVEVALEVRPERAASGVSYGRNPCKYIIHRGCDII